jgi:phosphonate transport system ATP-binding protein
MDLLVDTARTDGMTVLCSLHQLELASEYGDRVLGMKAGRVEIDAARTSLSRAQMEGLYRGVVRVDETGTDDGPASTAASA